MSDSNSTPRAPTRPEHPGKLLQRLLDEKGWTHEVFATIAGCSRQTVNNIVSGKSRITPEMATVLAAAFGTTAAEWMRSDADYQLSFVETDCDAVARYARLYDAAPIHDMQTRGWIREVATIDELEIELARFFGRPVSEGVEFPVATRTSRVGALTPTEAAWCFRARQLAAGLHVEAHSPDRMDKLARRLRQLAAYPEEVKRLPGVLSEHGIRFVIVEPLPGAHIDGAAFWIDDQPVIAVSARWDRIDAFWFTVMHEFAHIKNRDTFSADTDLLFEVERGVVAVLLAEDAAEKRANDEAAELLVPKAEIDSFVARVAPLYSAERIVQFAHRIKMHPGVIVGQLQHRGEVAYATHRSFLVKIRSILTGVALTDGWGQSIAPGVV